MGNPQSLPFSAEHVGSLKRPESLQRVRERLLGPQPLDKNLGAHDNAELRAIEDEAINQTIKLQEEVGIEVITDGEFRRRTWWTTSSLDLTAQWRTPEQIHLSWLSTKRAIGVRCRVS